MTGAPGHRGRRRCYCSTHCQSESETITSAYDTFVCEHLSYFFKILCTKNYYSPLVVEKLFIKIKVYRCVFGLQSRKL